MYSFRGDITAKIVNRSNQKKLRCKSTGSTKPIIHHHNVGGLRTKMETIWQNFSLPSPQPDFIILTETQRFLMVNLNLKISQYTERIDHIQLMLNEVEMFSLPLA